LRRSDQALHWNYTVPGSHHHVIVMDTRTQRLYRSPSDFPGLLAPDAIERQIVAAERKDVDVTLIISATPVLGVGFIEAIQYWGRWRIKNNYAYDCEAWNLEWGTFQKFLGTVSAMQRVVFLSGDVHYAFGSSLEYWDHARHTTAKFVDYTSSPLRNEGSSSQMAMFAVGYPNLFHLLGRTEMPTADFFAWDIVASNRHILRQVLKLIRSRIYQFWWSVPRLIDAMRSPYEIVLPAHGWPEGAFKDMPPNRSYRLHYLRDTKYHLDAPDDTIEDRPVARRGLWLKRMALRSITFVETKLGKTRRKLVRRTMVAQESPEKLPRG